MTEEHPCDQWKGVGKPRSGEGIPCYEHCEVVAAAGVSAADVVHRSGFVSFIPWSLQWIAIDQFGKTPVPLLPLT